MVELESHNFATLKELMDTGSKIRKRKEKKQTTAKKTRHDMPPVKIYYTICNLAQMGQTQV